MSDEDNWDAEFDVSPAPRKLSLNTSNSEKRPTTLFTHTDADDDNDDEEDWSNDFSNGGGGGGGIGGIGPNTSLGGGGGGGGPPQKKILGIKADPNAKEEDWDADFEFGNDNGGGI